MNEQALRRAWESSQRSTKEDWAEWMRHFAVELLKESPSHALRATHLLAQVGHLFCIICSASSSLGVWLGLEIRKAVNEWSVSFSAFMLRRSFGVCRKIGFRVTSNERHAISPHKPMLTTAAMHCCVRCLQCKAGPAIGFRVPSLASCVQSICSLVL